MFISRIKLYNWKNFNNVEVELPERVFIVGANASGKSNFLDAIRFLRDIVTSGIGFQHAVIVERGGLKKIRSLSARKKTDIVIEVDLSDSDSRERKYRYSLEFNNTGGGIRDIEPFVKKEEFEDFRSGKTIIRETSGEDIEEKRITWLEQPTQNREFREISTFFREIQYLNIVPAMIRDASSIVFSKGKEDFYGRNFIERMSSLNTRTKNSYLSKIGAILHFAVPQFSGLSIDKDAKGIPHLNTVFEHWCAKGNKQSEDQLSDGTIRLIGFLWALLDGNETVMLEEPEINLHTEIIKQFPEFISKLQKRKKGNRQVIITTHSYEILNNDSISPDEILIIETGNEGSLIKTVSSIPDAKAEMDIGLSAAEVSISRTKPKNICNMNQLELDL